jgi:hypothetical protein
MKVLDRAVTPDGTKIQIEDWKETYSFCNIYDIGTYPIAKNTSKYRWVEGGKEFRLTLTRFNSNEESKQAFADLISGAKTITDFADHFYNRDKDKYYMGLIPVYDEF